MEQDNVPSSGLSHLIRPYLPEARCPGLWLEYLRSERVFDGTHCEWMLGRRSPYSYR